MTGPQKRKGNLTQTKDKTPLVATGNGSTNIPDAKRGKKKIKPAEDSSGNNRKDSEWSIAKVLNLVCGLAVMAGISYAHSLYMYQIHENNMWFTNIKEVEREISFRTETGLYYSYYKQLVNASSLWQGIKELTEDRLTEHPDSINILERMNVYQELFLAAAYRGLGIEMPSILFYTYSIFALHGVLVAALYVTAWSLTGSWMTGLLSAAFYIFNRLDTTRVAYTAPLREHFSLPFLWLQAAAITVFFQNKMSAITQRASQVAVLLSTLFFCLFWQFNQFIMMLQGFALFGVWVLGLVPSGKVRSVVVCQQLSLFTVCLLQFGNKMLLGSLAVSFNFAFLAMILLVGDNPRPMSVFKHIFRVAAFSVLALVVMVLLSSVIKALLQVDSDEHIFKFLQNKFGVGDKRDFDSQLYLCLGIFQFMGTDIFERLMSNFVLPFYVASHVGMFGYLVYTVFKRWRVPPSSGDRAEKSPDLSDLSHNNSRSALLFHTVQSIFFLALAIMTERMKYLWTPYVCVLAAVGLADQAVWARLLRLCNIQDSFKVSVARNAVVVAVLGIMTAVLLPPVMKDLEELKEFWDPDTVELMEWIIEKTPLTASFTGSMQLLAGVKLCTSRPITNHPHYEDKYLRHKTKQLYQIYGKREPEDVHAILKSFKSDYIILEDSICRAPPRDGCRTPDLVDIDNGIQPDDDSVKIPGLVKSTVPSFCENVRHQKPTYSKYFRTVFVNRTFRIYKVM